MNYLLYNPLSNTNHGKDRADELEKTLGDCKVIDVTTLDETECRAFSDSLREDDVLYLVGGDGTLNKFANYTYGKKLPKTYYYSAGTGNDFLRDVLSNKTEGMVELNKYLEHLPVATINGKEYRYVNNVAFGMDGMVCELADIQKAKDPNKKINYTALAIKCVLFAYKKRNATVICDGVEKHYENVWICPTMNGKFMGGGMMVAPSQDRLNPDNKVTLVVVHTKSRLKVLLNFPKIFKGEHAGLKICDIITANKVTVKFTKPCAVQIDGETVLDVSEYTVETAR